MKLYLAGPMSGIPQHNYPAFHAAAARLRSAGYEVINPAEVNPESATAIDASPTPRSYWSACMRRDLPQMMSCEALALLPKWETSEGARLEVYVAAKLGLFIFDEATFKPIPDAGKRTFIKEMLAFPKLP